MIEKIRLTARKIQLGNVGLFGLFFITGAIAFFTANLLPLLYEKTLSVALKGYAYTEMINFAVAIILMLTVIGVYFAISSSIERYFLVLTEKKTFAVKEIVYYFSFKNFCKNFSYRIKMLFLKGTALIFCLLPFFLSLFSFIRFALSGSSLSIAVIIGVASAAFFVCGLVFYFNYSLSLFLCKYYFYKGESGKFCELVSKSQIKMKGKKAIISKIRFSFSGWLLLCVFVFSIPYVWSYYKQSLAVAAKSFLNS